MAATASAYNCTDRPVVINGDGDRLDGRTHGKVDPGLPEVAAAVSAGSLVVSDHVAERIEADQHDDDAGSPAPTPPREKGPRR